MQHLQVNSDAVGCSPVFEIRESQAPGTGINTYRNADPVPASQNRQTQFGESAHHPPFHLANVTKINLETQSPFVPSQGGGGVNVPSNGFSMGDSNEMDLSPDATNADQPSPATTANSRSQSQSGGGGSASHSSYSPGQHTEHLAYRPSPRMSNQIPPQNSASSSSPLNNIFYSTSNDMLNANFGYGGTPGMNTDTTIGGEFVMGNEWELGGISTGTGMTPMSDGGWNQMLESINLGWDGMGVPHQNPPPR